MKKRIQTVIMLLYPGNEFPGWCFCLSIGILLISLRFFEFLSLCHFSLNHVGRRNIWAKRKRKSVAMILIFNFLLCTDNWAVPAVSFGPSYCKIFWWMYRSQDKAWSLLSAGSEFPLYDCLFTCAWSFMICWRKIF